MLTLPVELTYFLAGAIEVFGWMIYPAAALMLLLMLVAAVWITTLSLFLRRL